MNFLTRRYYVRSLKQKNLKPGGLIIILKDHTAPWAVSKQMKTHTTLPELTLALVQ